MWKTGGKIVAALAFVAAAYGLFGGETEAADTGFDVIAVGGPTLSPYGWVDFCDRYRGECDVGAAAPQVAALNPSSLAVLRRVNAGVNAAIKPLSDMDHWGVVDQWDYPDDGYGDCEDYALLKRRLLMEQGFPRQALLMTVVKDHSGEGHAVLTVKTDRGEIILDNFDDELRGWRQTGYRFVKRQSEANQNVWLDVGDFARALVAWR